MSTAPHRLLTEAEYLAIERSARTKSDFYAGEMYAMAGAKRKHNLIVSNLIRVLGNQLQSKPCEIYPADMRVKVDQTGLYTYPDVVVVCGEPEFLDEHEDTLLNPTLLIEVLSESTYQYDRRLKSQHYQKLRSLREYLLIEQEVPLVERYERSRGGKWLLSSTNKLTATVPLKAIRCRLELSEIYARIKFPKGAAE